jgi:hypothetical protein
VYRAKELDDIGTTVTKVVLLDKLPLALGGTAGKLGSRDAKMSVLPFPCYSDADTPPSCFKFPAAETEAMVCQRVDGEVVAGQARRKPRKRIEEGQRLCCLSHRQPVTNGRIRRLAEGRSDRMSGYASLSSALGR